MKRILVITFLSLFIPLSLMAEGSAEASAGASGRGLYLADEGIIIPPEEVLVESYIAQVDYRYPVPEGDFGAYLYNANRQLSSEGQSSVLHLGVQGKYIDWDEIPPMNLAIVIDLSNSMAEDNKLDWIKSSFRILLDRIRPEDFISVVAFNDSTEVLFSSGKISNRDMRNDLIRTVDGLIPTGGSDLEMGLKAGYEQIMRNYQPDYVNRVFFLSDGTEISTRLSRAGGKTGKIRATLIWDNRNDLDLHMETPGGETINYSNRRSASGGQLDVDQNVNGETDKPVENIFWTDNSLPEEGPYTVYVHHFGFHERERVPTPFTVQLKVGKEVLYFDGETTKRKEKVQAFQFSYAENTQRKAEIYQLAEQYKALGINVTTIGVGTAFDLDFMNNLAIESGGSSRFIANKEEMEEMFGPEFDRMIVPAARNLVIDLKFLVPVKIHETWGYKHEIMNNQIRYRQDTLHTRDYETMIVRYSTLPGLPAGPVTIARADISYETLEGTKKVLSSDSLDIVVTDDRQAVSGYSDGKVLHSGTMMDFALRLIEVGTLYYDIAGEYIDYGEEMPPSVKETLEQALRISRQGRGELENAGMRLDEEDAFADEIQIFRAYENILYKMISGDEPAQSSVVQTESETILPPLPSDRSIQTHVENLVDEIVLGLPGTEKTTVAFPGISSTGDDSNELMEMVNSSLLTQISSRSNLDVVERMRIDEIIEEQKLLLSGLLDTDSAIEVGKLASARYILTGTLMETSESVLIFVRVLNVETGIIESAAQTIVSRKQMKS